MSRSPRDLASLPSFERNITQFQRCPGDSCGPVFTCLAYGSLRSAMVGAFILRKLTSTTNQGVFPPREPPVEHLPAHPTSFYSPLLFNTWLLSFSLASTTLKSSFPCVVSFFINFPSSNFKRAKILSKSLAAASLTVRSMCTKNVFVYRKNELIPCAFFVLFAPLSSRFLNFLMGLSWLRYLPPRIFS